MMMNDRIEMSQQAAGHEGDHAGSPEGRKCLFFVNKQKQKNFI